MILTSMKSGLFFLGFLLAYSANAQLPSQSLFYRYEQLRYRQPNQSAYNYFKNGVLFPPGNAVGLPLRCVTTNKNAYTTWERGEDFFQSLRWEDAVKIYSAIIRLDSSFCDAYLRLGQSYAARNDLAAAILTFQLALRKFPSNPMVYLGLGQLYLITGYPETAHSYFEKMFPLDPENPEYYLGVSIALYQIKRNADALEYFLKGMEKLRPLLDKGSSKTPAYAWSQTQPKGQDTYLNVYEGILYYKLNQNQKSLQLLKDTYVNFNDTDLNGLKHYFMGLCYLAKGENYYPQARLNIQKAKRSGITIDSTVAQSIGLLWNPGDFKNLALLENYSDELRCASANKKNKLKAEQAGIVFENREINESIRLYSAIIQDNSSSSCDAYVKLAECYHLQQKSKESLNVLRVAVRKLPNNIGVTLQLARELFRADSLTSSLQAYRAAIQLDSSDYRAYYGASLLLAHQHRNKEALDLLILSKRGWKTLRKIVMMEGILHYQLGYPHVALNNLTKAADLFVKDPVPMYYLALCYYVLGGKYLPKATDCLNEAIELGALVDYETKLKFGLDPNVRRTFQLK